MATCASCGSENPLGHRYCGACGTHLAATHLAATNPTPTPQPPPTSERRLCSVLFADLVGFTTLAEARDHEEVRELLSSYFDTARTVITRHGGVVEKFIGDAVMAVWGAPVATEGDAERAVRAALDLVAAIRVLGDDLGVQELSLRAGVVTGEITATIGAVGEGMVAGDAVNTAARVQSAAAPGAVLTDATTRRLARGVVGFEDAGEHELKGKRGLHRLWRATRVLGPVGVGPRVDGLQAEIVGRDAEYRTLRELFHASAERRAPQLVVVTGSAGSGKSRLGWELRTYLDGLPEVVRWHSGRCLSYGEGVAFWALAEAVRRRLDIAEEDSVDAGAAKLLAGVDAFVADEAQRSYVGVRLARLLGLTHPDDGGADLVQEELFAGWRLFFEQLASAAPTVLFVEDAQYADDGLLDFLVHLVDWSRESPLYVVVLARSELLERRPDLSRGRNRTTVSLDELDEPSIRALVEGLVHDIPVAAVNAIVAQAQGNPLFAVETVRSLIDRDVVTSVEGEYRMVGDLGALSVPDSLHGLLAARLDALDPALRSLISDAAVLGTAFAADALVEVSGRPSVEVLSGLDELARREILGVQVDPLSPERGSFVFSQNLLRQVAYETLSRRDRRTRHLAVAEQLQRGLADGGDEVMDVVAQHLLDALHAVSGPDDDALRDQARECLIRAGERSKRSGAQGRAAASFARAARLTDDPAQSARLWERAFERYLSAGQLDEAGPAAARARKLHLSLSDDRAVASALANLGVWMQSSRRLDEAVDTLEQALQVLRPDPGADTVKALAALGGALTFRGQAERARTLLDEALGLAQALGAEAEVHADLFSMLGLAELFAQRSTQAAVHLQHAADLAERVGDRRLQVRSLNLLANCHLVTDPAAARDTADLAADLARRAGDRLQLSKTVVTAVEARLLIGEWTVASATLSPELDDAPDDVYLLMITAVLSGLRGDEVSHEALAALADLRSSDDVQSRAYARFADGVRAYGCGDVAAAFEHAAGLFTAGPTADFDVGATPAIWCWPLAVRCAVELGRPADVHVLIDFLDALPPGHLPAVLRGCRALATAQCAVADGATDDVVVAAFDAALTTLRSVASPYHLAHGLLDQSAWDARHGREVADAMTEASEIADRLGSVDLERRVSRPGHPREVIQTTGRRARG